MGIHGEHWRPNADFITLTVTEYSTSCKFKNFAGEKNGSECIRKTYLKDVLFQQYGHPINE